MVTELQDYIYADKKREDPVTLFQRSLYALRDVARIWNDSLAPDFDNNGMKPLNNTPYLFPAKQINTV